MALTMVIGYRDRDIERVERSLGSLDAQTNTAFRVLVVNYGSSSSYSAALAACVVAYSFASVLWVDARGWEWNRAAAMNSGATCCADEYVFLSDADAVYPPDFVERLYGHLSPTSLVVSDFLRLPRGFESWSALGDPGLVGQLSPLGGAGLVGCATEQYCAAGGLDEGFGYWGYEDVMFVSSMRQRGCAVEFPADLYCYHQHHEKTVYSIPYAIQFHNVVRYYSMADRCGDVDGPLPPRPLTKHSGPERPIFEFVDPETGSIRPGVAVERVDAYNAADTTTVVSKISESGEALWAFPSKGSPNPALRQVNRLLRTKNLRMEKGSGYMDDFARGLTLAIPGFFRDYYLDCAIDGKRYGVFLK